MLLFSLIATLILHQKKLSIALRHQFYQSEIATGFTPVTYCDYFKNFL